jgi:hypothetical protein
VDPGRVGSFCHEIAGGPLALGIRLGSADIVVIAAAAREDVEHVALPPMIAGGCVQEIMAVLVATTEDWV